MNEERKEKCWEMDDGNSTKLYELTYKEKIIFRNEKSIVVASKLSIFKNSELSGDGLYI